MGGVRESRIRTLADRFRRRDWEECSNRRQVDTTISCPFWVFKMNLKNCSWKWGGADEQAVKDNMTHHALSQLYNTAKLSLLRFDTSVSRFPNCLSLSEVACWVALEGGKSVDAQEARILQADQQGQRARWPITFGDFGKVWESYTWSRSGRRYAGRKKKEPETYTIGIHEPFYKVCSETGFRCRREFFVSWGEPSPQTGRFSDCQLQHDDQLRPGVPPLLSASPFTACTWRGSSKRLKLGKQSSRSVG